MPRLTTLSEINRQAMLSFPCIESSSTPWSPLRKPLSQAKLSLVTSAGLHLRGDKPFIGDPKGGDASYRIIPSTTQSARYPAKPCQHRLRSYGHYARS